MTTEGTGVSQYEFGLLLDIESGSIGAAIVTKPTHGCSTITWSIRQELPFRSSIAFDDAANDLKKAIRDVAARSGIEGIRELRATNPEASISEVLVRIAAPWSFTITKTVHTKHDRAFTVTRGLIAALERRAVEEAGTAAKAAGDALNTLTMISNKTINVGINGYRVQTGALQETTNISLSQAIEFTYADLKAAIEDAVDRAFPMADISIHTAMETYCSALTTLPIHVDNSCLLIVGAEATELGVIRDGILCHTTYTPYGMRTLARQLHDNSGISQPEAMSYLRSDGTLDLGSKKERIDEVIELFETNLVELLERTGDTLLLPKTVFMHADAAAGPFFVKRVEAAMKRTVGGNPTVHAITPEHFTGEVADTGLLLGSRVYPGHAAAV